MLGFIVAGYAGREQQAEAWFLQFDSATERPEPKLEADRQTSGWAAYAQDEALRRLFLGYDPLLPAILETAVGAVAADATVTVVNQHLLRKPAQAAMPFGDAVALAKFMVDVTAGYSRYLLGADTVGGPVEVAGMTRHEGFKWISRKHYYPADLNPEDPHRDY